MEPAAIIRSIQSEYFRLVEGHLVDVWAPFERHGVRIGDFLPRDGAHPRPGGRGLHPVREPIDYTDRVRPLLEDVEAFWEQHASALYAAVRALPGAKVQIGDVGRDLWDYQRVLLRLGLSFDTMLAFDPLAAVGESQEEGDPEPRYLSGDPATDRVIYAYLTLRTIAKVALADTELPLLVIMPYLEPTPEEAGVEESFGALFLLILSDVFSPHDPLVDWDDWSRLAMRLGPSRIVSMVEAAPQLAGYFGGERPRLADVLGCHHQEQRAGGLHLPEDVFVPITLMIYVVPPFIQLRLREAFAVRQGAAILVPSTHWTLNRYRLQLESRMAGKEGAHGFVAETNLTWPGARTLEDLLALRRSGLLEDVRHLTRSLANRSASSRDVMGRCDVEEELQRLASTLAGHVGTPVRPVVQVDGHPLEPHPATFAAACSSWCTPPSGGDRPPRPLALLDAVRDG